MFAPDKLSLNTLNNYIIVGSKFNLSHINHILNINSQRHNIERVDQLEQLGITIDDQLK